MLPLEICQTVLNSRNAYLSTFKNFLNEWYEKGIVKKSNELNKIYKFDCYKHAGKDILFNMDYILIFLQLLTTE